MKITTTIAGILIAACFVFGFVYLLTIAIRDTNNTDLPPRITTTYRANIKVIQISRYNVKCQMDGHVVNFIVPNPKILLHFEEGKIYKIDYSLIYYRENGWQIYHIRKVY